MAHTTDKIIDKIKELKGTVLPSGKLILFGSQARRDATTDSDWDMLLLLDKENYSFRLRYLRLSFCRTGVESWRVFQHETLYPIRMDETKRYTIL